MALSQLLYGVVIWGNTYDNHLKRLIILQNKAVKIVAGGQQQDHVKPFYHRLQILKLKDLYVYEVAKLVHKTSRKKLPNRLNCHFTSVRAIHTRATHLTLSKLNLYLEVQNTKITTKFLVSRSQNLELDRSKLPFDQFE